MSRRPQYRDRPLPHHRSATGTSSAINGIGNVRFSGGDLNTAVAFYERLGLDVKFRVPQALALVTLGCEPPGLLLRSAADDRVPAHTALAGGR